MAKFWKDSRHLYVLSVETALTTIYTNRRWGRGWGRNWATSACTWCCLGCSTEGGRIFKYVFSYSITTRQSIVSFKIQPTFIITLSQNTQRLPSLSPRTRPTARNWRQTAMVTWSWRMSCQTHLSSFGSCCQIGALLSWWHLGWFSAKWLGSSVLFAYLLSRVVLSRWCILREIFFCCVVVPQIGSRLAALLLYSPTKESGKQISVLSRDSKMSSSFTWAYSPRFNDLSISISLSACFTLVGM